MQSVLPYYPNRTTHSPKSFLSETASKKEFCALTMTNDARLYPHQAFIARFISPYTLYDNLMLFHEMGSGKTQSAIYTAETLMGNPNAGIVKTIVIVRGRGLGQNFIHELVNKSTDGKYGDVKRKLWRPFYDVWTMEVFGKTVAKLSDRDLLHRFNNCLFIIDEAHHLKKNLEGAYTQIHRLLHLLPHRKVLLLTGTPMKDDASELANGVNLLLTMENQLPFGAEFNQRYFRGDRLVSRRALRDKLAGIVSFYRGKGPNVDKVIEGEVVAPMKHIPVVVLPMAAFQEQAWRRAHKADAAESVVYMHSRQASLFVFPDGSYGRDGFRRYIEVVKRKTLAGKTSTRYKLHPDLVRAVVDSLGRHSVKFKKVLDGVTAPTAPKTFVYSEFVHGGGAILLAEVLKLHGYTQATGKETTFGKRYILATNQSVTTNLVQLIERFNSADNDEGRVIQIFIGSQIVSEGYSLRNVAVEYILTPHWNFSETEQIIARCWRLNSHTGVGRRLSVNLLAAVASDPVADSTDDSFNRYGIDLYMYKTSETKDYKIKQVERLLKEVAVDGHNYTPSPVHRDGSRECDYTQCAVSCVGQPREEVDQASYDVLYPPRETLETTLLSLFADARCVPVDAALAALGKTPGLLLLTELLFGNLPMRTDAGRAVFLRKTGGLLTLVDDPTTPVDSTLTLPPLNDRSITVAELMRDLEGEWLLQSVRLLFEAGAPAKQVLHKLPRSTQHLILTACLYADSLQRGDAGVVRGVLDYYRGFYQRGPPTYVWLFYEKFGTTELVVADGVATWAPARRDVFQERREELYASPVGYYGLYNPHLNEFCLRKVTGRTETDLRKVAVGRRCDDWDQSSLTDILVNRLRVKVDLDTCNRADLCELIKRELFARQLVMYNFDCGNQFKIRGRV